MTFLSSLELFLSFFGVKKILDSDWECGKCDSSGIAPLSELGIIREEELINGRSNLWVHVEYRTDHDSLQCKSDLIATA